MNVKALEAAAKRTDLSELLDHIAWTDILKPELQRRRDWYLSVLVSSTLKKGYRLPNGEMLTPEMAAGVVYGIDMIEEIIKRVLSRGEAALTALKNEKLGDL